MLAGDEDDSFRDVLSNIKLGESVKIWDIREGIFIGCFSPDREGLLSRAGAKEGDVRQEKYDDGTVMFRHKNAPANFWSSNAWNLETNMLAGSFNEKIRKYWTNTSAH